MDLESFLSLHGTSWDEVGAVARQELGGVAPDEALFAVGSPVEGRASPKSDLDLLWITPRTEADLPARERVTWVVGRCLVDARVLRAAYVEQLVGRLEDWAARPWSIAHAAKFSGDERTLLHRLIHRRVLCADDSGRIVDRVPKSEDLARMKLQIARQTARTFLVDLLGYRQVGDYRSMAFCAQVVLGNAVDALLAGYGHTNPQPKWRTRLLGDVPADWEAALVRRPEGRSAADTVWDLCRTPAAPEPKPVLDYVLRIVNFTRAVFLWAELQLLHAAVAVPVPRWRTTGSRGVPLAPLDFDVDYALSDGCIYLARLNEFEDPVRLSPEDFACAMLFDGRTTAAEAAGALTSIASGREASEQAVRVGAVLERAGLTWSDHDAACA